MLRGTTDPTGLKALHQRLYTTQLPLMARKGEVEKGDKIKLNLPRQTLKKI